jgi:pyruvate dehydrogenase E2 component (dihydrolipoamide acetyltransferase)
MAIEIVMPRLGWTMQEGIFGEWLKQDGEEVKSGDLLFTVESDKATQEVENFDNGILRIPPDGPKAGDVIPVGGRLGYIVQPGEAVPFETEQPSETQQSAPEMIAPAPSSQASRDEQSSTRSVTERDGDRLPAISPRARRVAAELGLEWTQLVGSGRTGRIVERDIRAAYEQQSSAQAPTVPDTRISAKVSPVAQRMAQATGVNLAEVAAQKPGQRIQRQDIEAAIAARSEAPATVTQEAVGESVPVSRMRSVIAQRMAESAHTTAPVTLTTEADATEFVALREQLKASHTPRDLLVPSYNDLLIKLTSVALQEYPLLNASWRGQEIFIPANVNIGLAVDSEEGLVVPVVRAVESKSVRQIAAETRGLIDKVQAHKISSDELQNGTFTITNLGAYNIDAFTPIINPPQCAILGVGRIVKKPAVYKDEVVPRHRVALSLTFDHRIVDGGPAARFLNTIRTYIEEPALWLVA